MNGSPVAVDWGCYRNAGEISFDGNSQADALTHTDIFTHQ